jgi:hypothetical protein
MWNRFEASILEGRRYFTVLALSASLLMVVLGIVAGVALAQDDTSGGIDANDCTQVQLAFINQFIDNDDGDGNQYEEPFSQEELEAAAVQISLQIANVNQQQVLNCITKLQLGDGGDDGNGGDNGDTTNGETTNGDITNGETTNGDITNGDGDKVTLCHQRTETITVDASAQETHLDHGDTLGACGETTNGDGDTTNGDITGDTTTGDTTNGDTTTPKDGVIDDTIPKDKVLPDTGGVAILMPALALLTLVVSGAAARLLFVRRR